MSSYNLRSRTSTINYCTNQKITIQKESTTYQGTLTNIIENAYIRYGKEDIVQDINDFLFTYKDQIGIGNIRLNVERINEYGCEIIKDFLCSMQGHIHVIMRNFTSIPFDDDNIKQNYLKVNKFFYAVKDFVLLFVKYIANNYKINNKIDIDESHELIVEKIDLLKIINKMINIKTNLYKDYIQKQQNHYKIDNVNKECSICCNCDENDECKYVQLNKCKHTFHIKCIKEWFDIKNNCPLCREIYEN